VGWNRTGISQVSPGASDAPTQSSPGAKSWWSRPSTSTLAIRSTPLPALVIVTDRKHGASTPIATVPQSSPSDGCGSTRMPGACADLSDPCPVRYQKAERCWADRPRPGDGLSGHVVGEREPGHDDDECAHAEMTMVALRTWPFSPVRLVEKVVLITGLRAAPARA
jgi:hypothetical protein